jgi:ADP-ribose pyrophosphatase
VHSLCRLTLMTRAPGAAFFFCMMVSGLSLSPLLAPAEDVLHQHNVQIHWPVDDTTGRNNMTLSTATVASSKFARCQVHHVRLPNGEEESNWVYLDERPHVNILVRSKADRRFVVFRQAKYASGNTLAPVGGFIEDGESPAAAAKRELHEELGLRTAHLTPLGSFLGSANRGSGRVFAFFADLCVPSSSSSKPSKPSPIPSPRRAGHADLEGQHAVRLTRAELQEVLLAGHFKEAKWTATVALALLGVVEHKPDHQLRLSTWLSNKGDPQSSTEHETRQTAE